MAATFKFISDAVDQDLFTVTNFSGTEGLSQLYRYEIQVKASTSRVNKFVDDRGLEDFVDELLDHTARLVMEENKVKSPVNGMLASFDENQTAGGYTWYTAVLVPRLWKLSIYRTNEIYVTEKTVDQIIETVLDPLDFIDGKDYFLSLNGKLLERDYVCQFRESDFHFISRLMENEGIYYYFEQGQHAEKLMIVDGADYDSLEKPEIIFDVNAQAARRHESLFSWTRRTQRLPTHVSVRDYNPDQPSLDVQGTVDVDTLSDASESGELTDYLYGDHFNSEEEAARLARLRAEEIACRKTRFYGEGAVCGFRAGYTFKMGQHPNTRYNDQNYLIIEVTHEGTGLDSKSDASTTKGSSPQYSNTFVAMEKHISFRPPLLTKKPRFYGTMTAFIYAEAETDMAEIDDQGRYRVHLPFDRADGGKKSSDPNRKASCWVRMAQPYAGENQGMVFPLKHGTEVLLTFINGDPDQPIISAALPNAATPSLLKANSNIARISTPDVFIQKSNTRHSIIGAGKVRKTPVQIGDDPDTFVIGGGMPSHINVASGNMQPPWQVQTGLDPQSPPGTYNHDPRAIEMKIYDFDFAPTGDVYWDGDDDKTNDPSAYNSDRGAKDSYAYANGRTFAYPQHERVYFIGTFHEDFHLKDNFTVESSSYTEQREVFNFPAPGGDGNQISKGSCETEHQLDKRMNPTGKRGVTEDRRWGDQMFYSWGHIYSWSGGEGLGSGGAQEAINYGNGYTENLIAAQSYTLAQARAGSIPATATDKIRFDEYKEMKDDWTNYVIGRSPIFPWISESAVGAETACLKDQKYIDPSAASVERTFGSTYSYQMGYSVDIREGTSVSKQYGDDISYVSGDSWSSQEGDSTSMLLGDSYNTQFGRAHDYFMGGTFSLNLAGSMDLNLATSFSLTVGIPVSIDIGAAAEIFVGGKFEMSLGPSMEFEGTGKFSFKPSKVDISAMELKTRVIDIEKKEVALSKRLVSLEKPEVWITNPLFGSIG